MIIADKDKFDAVLDTLAAEISEALPIESMMLVGIQRRGVFLARRLADKIAGLKGQKPTQGILDITFYRDDLSMIAVQPVVHSTDLPEDISDKVIVLVDDVLYTGRTIRAALAALADNGRAKAVKLAVLVDRGWRQLPIQADFKGLDVKTAFADKVAVRMEELDGADLVEVIS